jgi:hypothetical protein
VIIYNKMGNSKPVFLLEHMMQHHHLLHDLRILGEMVNYQNVNQTYNGLTFWQVDVFGKLIYCWVTISPSFDFTVTLRLYFNDFFDFTAVKAVNLIDCNIV